MIVLVCTLEPRRISWLPQFVRHHRSIAVERFLLTLRLEPGAGPAARDRDDERFRAILFPIGIDAGCPLGLRMERAGSDQE